MSKSFIFNIHHNMFAAGTNLEVRRACCDDDDIEEGNIKEWVDSLCRDGINTLIVRVHVHMKAF